MKYMGSKRRWLEKGLGKIICSEVSQGARFVDLFTGTGQVSWHVAENVTVPVLAADLQSYATTLAGAVIERVAPMETSRIVEEWLEPARASLFRSGAYDVGSQMQVASVGDVVDARTLCNSVSGGPIWTAYGGHYFSPKQAAKMDVLISSIPDEESALALVCRYLLIVAASKCAAAPGHTAQPFQPSRTALPYILNSWKYDPMAIIVNEMDNVSSRFALCRGATRVADANRLANELAEGDVVFIDPPYSAVQYSRFYHVLETVARGSCGPVSGVGRYPSIEERPRSEYSMRSKASVAIMSLLSTLAMKGCTVILTFPYGLTSNGIDGAEMLADIGRHFSVKQEVVQSRFSTLGGNGKNRRARHWSKELVAVMKPLSGRSI